MRVAMLSYHTCPLATLGGKDTGGMNVYVREVTRRMGQMGVHVDVYTRSQDEHVPHVLHDLGYGNRVVHVPAGPEVPLPKDKLAELVPDFVEGIRSFTEAKGLTYDLIHSHYWMSGVAARDLASLWNAPIVHMFHTLGLMKQRVARLPGEAEGDYRVKGERQVLDLADKIIAATQAEVAQLQWLYQADTDKIVIIPPGVDKSHFYPIPADEAKEFVGLSPNDQMVLFVGRIEPLKGIDTLIEAIALMRRQGVFADRYICLAVIGGEAGESDDVLSEEMARLHEMRTRYGLVDMVTFLGRKGQDTLPYYYSAAEAVVVPSFYESFGMVALEAMACGTPVVASETGGLAFLVKDGETGFTVPVDDPAALADRLSLILSDPSLRREMGKKAEELSWKYDWSKITSQVVGLYATVLEGNS